MSPITRLLRAEAFRHGGFEGIIYGSHLGTGKTYALFDSAVVKCQRCQLYTIKSVDVKCEEYVSWF